MSRKKKEENMSLPEELEEVTPAGFPYVALGFHPDANGRFTLVEVPYNPETGDVGFVTELSNDIKEEIINSFKVNAAYKIIGREGQ